MRNTLLLAIVLAVVILPAQATVLMSDVGVFSDPNDVITRTFYYNPVTMGGILNIQTWGYGGSSGAPGGTNLAGLVIPAGGFDPQVFLYSGTAGSESLVAWDDDGSCPPGTPSPDCYDSTLTLTGLPEGTYTLALTAFNNDPVPMSVGGALGVWTDNGSFNGRSPNYAVDVQAIPEPLTFGLIGSGLIVLGLLRRRAH